MNEYLKGTPGVKILQRDAKGQIMRNDVEIVEPKQGDNVYLTIDARIQYITEKALRAVGRGAAVVIDPNNGDVLAMASVPSYDPNKFIPYIAAKDWLELNKDETNPMLNRAISAYAPGSTYKVPVGLSGLRAGVGDKTFTCSGGVTYGNKYMMCWVTQKHLPPHGTLRLPDALKYSCNAFSISTEMRPASTTSWPWATCSAWGKNPACRFRVRRRRPARPDYLAQISPTSAGRAATRPTPRSARAWCWPRPSRWR